MNKWQKTQGIAILQIAGENESFIIDLVSLRNDEALDDMLTRIFSNESSIVIGCGFASDIDQFNKELPTMKFYQNVPYFLEIQDYYQAIVPDFKNKGGFGLAKICENIMKKNLCKGEQMSNWENRPLRFSQEHYAALDAWIMIELVYLMQQRVQKDKLKVDINTFITFKGEKPVSKLAVKKSEKRGKNQQRDGEQSKEANNRKRMKADE